MAERKFALKAELNFLLVLDIVHKLRPPLFVSSFSRPPHRYVIIFYIATNVA